MSSIILTKLQQMPLQQTGQQPVYLKDPQNIGAILGTSLYAASTPSSKTHSDDQAIVGVTKEGYPFFLCIDGFHGCDAAGVFAFIEKEVLGLVETYQLQLQQGASPESVIHAWQEAIFEAKLAYLNRGIDFTLGVVVTFSSKNKTYAVGWSVGDIGMLYKPFEGSTTNVLAVKKVGGFKDAFDDRTCQDAVARKEAVARSEWFCRPIGIGDEIVAYTYAPEGLLWPKQEGNITLATLNTTQLDHLIPSAIDQLWTAIHATHQIALQHLQGQENYRIGDDCTLCQLRFPSIKTSLKQKFLSLFKPTPTPSPPLAPAKVWVAAQIGKGKQKAGIDPAFAESETKCSREVMEAVDASNFAEQVHSLEKLSDLHVTAQNWVRGATLLNSALAICQKQLNDQKLEQRLLLKIKGIEALFLKNKGIEIPVGHAEAIFKYRSELKQIRSDFIDGIVDGTEEVIPIWGAVHSLTDSYKKFLAMLIQDAQAILGTPLVKWACIGMGSMARDEMCMISDSEFAFLLEANTEEALEYFRTLARLVELMIINLGETRFPLYRDGGSPTIGGFSMDTGGNTPLGKPGLYELIQTPQGLSLFQSERWMEDDIIVMNALATACHITGEQKLVEAYNKAKETQLNQKTIDGIPLRKKLALKLLRGHFEEFKPDLSLRKENEKAFGVKKELYRPFQEMMNCLALFYNLKSNNTLERIQELTKKGIFSSDGAGNLETVIGKVLLLRTLSHQFYKEEKEFLCHIDPEKPEEPRLFDIDPEKPEEPRLFYLKPQMIDEIRTIYKVLIPFCECCKEFYSTNDKRSFRDNDFFDGLIDKAKNVGYGTDASEVTVKYHQALALDPQNVPALIKLSRVSTEFGDTVKGLEYANQALQIAENGGDESLGNVALSHRALAYACADIGKLQEAYEHHKKALSIYLKLFGENHKKTAKCYYNVAGLVLDNYPEDAFQYYEKALNIYLSLNDQEDRHVMVCYNGMGSAMEKMGKTTEEAWSYHIKAQEIAKKFRFERKKCHLVARSYGSSGDFLFRLGQYEDALTMYQEALSQDLKPLVSQKAHPRMAHWNRAVGDTFTKLEKYEEAFNHYQVAARLLEKICGKEDERLLLLYNRCGVMLGYLKRYEEAIEFELNSLKSSSSPSGEEDPKWAGSYYNLGHYYEALGKHSDALKFFQKALELRIKLYGKEDERVTTLVELMNKIRASSN